jgi:hypothetical protein
MAACFTYLIIILGGYRCQQGKFNLFFVKLKGLYGFSSFIFFIHELKQISHVHAGLPDFAHTANEGTVRIQNKCLVPIYVFLEMKLCALRTSHLQKKNYDVLSPNFHNHVSVSGLYIPRIGLPILLQPIRQTDPGNI